MAGEPYTEVLPALSAGASERLPAAPVRLSGARKAAVLMAALGSERAASLIQLLGEDEIESLSREMARLSSVNAETTRSIFSELTAGTGEGTGNVQGGLEFAQEVIERALGAERAADILGRLSGGESRPFEFLRRIPPERIATLMRGESAQTVALVLASLHANLAAGVLAHLPAAEQPDVALRIARMGEASTAVIQKVEQAIRGKLGEEVEEEYSTTGGAKALAGILNHADRTLERNVLENLAGTDKDLAEEVRGMLFVFEDIVKLDERAVQQVLREVDQKDLVLALRGAAENVMEIVLTNMSERGAEMLKEEMEVQPPQRKRDIDAAQSRVVAVIRKLEEAGTIVIGGGGEGDGEESEDVV
jgi:flagellar motor switch protein FliG